MLAKYFLKKGDVVHALPIVGDGENYKKENIRIIGKTKKFRTAGIGYNSFRGRMFEIFGGQIIYFFKNWASCNIFGRPSYLEDKTNISDCLM